MARKSTSRHGRQPGSARKAITPDEERLMPPRLQTALKRLRGLGLEIVPIRTPAGFELSVTWPHQPEVEEAARAAELIEASLEDDLTWMKVSQPQVLAILPGAGPGLWNFTSLDPISSLLSPSPGMGQVRISHPREVALVDWAEMAQSLTSRASPLDVTIDEMIAFVELPSGVMSFTENAASDSMMAAIQEASQPVHPFTPPEVMALAADLAQTLDNGCRRLASGDLLTPDGRFVQASDIVGLAGVTMATGDITWARDNLGHAVAGLVEDHFRDVQIIFRMVMDEGERLPDFAIQVLAACRDGHADEIEFADPVHRRAFKRLMQRLEAKGFDLDDLQEAAVLVLQASPDLVLPEASDEAPDL